MRGDGRENMRMHMCTHTETHTSMHERGLETKEETHYLDCFRTQVLKCGAEPRCRGGRVCWQDGKAHSQG